MGNKRRRPISAALCAVFFFFVFTGPVKITPVLLQKVKSAVQTTFGTEAFELRAISVGEDLQKRSLVAVGEEQLFSIEEKNEIIGYLYVGTAPSMKKEFDYVVFFSPDLTVKKAKVLIYREDHGRQIGSQRWLQQFIGLQPGSDLVYGEDVDAVSGATISAKSMTRAVSEVLKTMALLRSEKVF